MLETLAQVVAAASWKALLVGIAAWLIGRICLGRRPAAHHALWTAACVTLLLLPGLEAWRAIQPPSQRLRLEIAVPAAAPLAVTNSAGRDVRPAIPDAYPSVFAAFYLAGLAAALIPLLLGWRGANRFRAGAADVRAERELAILRSVTGRAGLGQAPPLLESGLIRGPVTVGVVRPAIVLPAERQDWNADRLAAVLAHECAHVARRDTLSAALVALVRALYWFHPMAWPLGRHTARLMEQACDDFAVHLLGDARAYANALLATASLHSNAQPRNLGALAMASHLSSRIDRILQGLSTGAGVLGRRTLAALAVAAASATFAAAVLTPVWAQQSGVTLSGAALDASGARVPGVAVVVRDRARGVTEATVSGGADGSFALHGLPPSADYEIELEAGGFASSRQTVSLLEDASIEVELQVGRIREAIVVEADAPEPNEASNRAPQRIRVGGKVQAARLMTQVQPEYPEAARADGVEGAVLLEAVISASGQPVSLRAVNNLVDRRLAAAATDAVSQWRYKPTQLNGQPVEVATTITVGFCLRR